MTKILFIIFMMAMLALTACSEKKEISTDGVPSMASDSESSQRESKKFLAYEHFVSIDTTEEDLAHAYKKTIATCVNDKENSCTILDSNISSGNYVSARIKLRIKPRGVIGIIESATSNGSVINESTHVEDLAQPITDNEQRLKMLESHRDRLLALQEKAVNDIESLIKISEELSKVQAELESAKGQNAHLLQRVNMDIVNINFVVEANRSFWKPVSKSFSQFSNRLSDGISDSIRGVAYLLPWSIVVVLALFFFRFLWRRGKKI